MSRDRDGPSAERDTDCLNVTYSASWSRVCVAGDRSNPEKEFWTDRSDFEVQRILRASRRTAGTELISEELAAFRSL